MKPPRAEKVPKSLEIHGHKRIDEYYWLNERENPKVIDYLNQENSFLKSELAHTEELQEELFLEMKSRIKEDDQSVPFELNDYWYYTRYEEGKEYPYYCRKLGSLEAQEEIILDVNEMAEGQAFCNVKGISIHPNNQLMAFGVDFVGRRQYEIKIKSLQTSNILEDSIENTTGGSVWSQAEDQLFYTERDETLRSARVMRHELGTSSKDDVLVYEEEDETFDVSVGKSKSKNISLFQVIRPFRVNFSYSSPVIQKENGGFFRNVNAIMNIPSIILRMLFSLSQIGRLRTSA